jgi:hypothetical protein
MPRHLKEWLPPQVPCMQAKPPQVPHMHAMSPIQGRQAPTNRNMTRGPTLGLAEPTLGRLIQGLHVVLVHWS